MHELGIDIEAIGRIPAVVSILDVVSHMTGMGFVAVARVAGDRWIACSTKDTIGFGVQSGDELDVETTICHEVRQHRTPVIIDHVEKDEIYCGHATPQMYQFQSYISMPIYLSDGSFFGTLCAIDPKPRKLDTPEIRGAFTLFAELIGLHLSSNETLKATQAALRTEREDAKLREQFIAVLGHDLRNPLASIQAGTRLLRRNPERGDMVLMQMERSVQRMAGLIDNIMDFTRGRLGGGLSLEINPDVALEALLQQVVSEVRATNPDHPIDCAIDLPSVVPCDAARIGQMFSNLLVNAVTHGTPHRPVHVMARIHEAVFELSVTNEGMAIPDEAMGSLFQPFFRAQVRASQQGLGLGLYIAAEIAQAHGGTLAVASTADATCFTFRMPLQLV
ncbi:GAF domain-containing sensor histidine kinase [Tanticharoenia sakaeratensis]|uniref:histidine kinase n=1 Tax=Tanticharoenia sakaeratensis NBRC 103193 TaxID=1231623 RepID=A0A0D6MM07_9PROT|nr:GAF domain-containing sensor histidine kinase [Tanticharoenia sakaeratensis]GAN54712.1 sensor histidine kinase [Tanticharoenia sakaeratensis NBRC 103193]GBQ16882.1 sensor histidine kinase [Tanticharoenia sakaeratensis NBRC 103193]